MRRGKPAHIPQRLNDTAYGIVALYQAEYRGIVQYYRLAYNIHMLSRVKYVAEVSLVKTLANKYRTSCNQIYRRHKRELLTVDGTYKVIGIVVDRGPKKKPLTAYFGGLPLKRNEHAAICDKPATIWGNRSELEQRLLAEKCELCGSEDQVEVHHVRKLASLKGKSRWEKVMAARRRKTLVVCHACHAKIHNGTYDGPRVSR